MTILVVDDNTTLLRKMVRSLVLAKHQVRSASNIRQAREMLMKKPPKVLCLDLQLPDGNGLDLLKEIRQSGNRLPVVIISGHRSKENHERANRLGAAGFLAKPFALSELNDLLSKLLDTPPDGNGKEAPDAAQRGTGSQAELAPLSSPRLSGAKWAYATRRVHHGDAKQLITGDYKPQVGDLVLARVDKLNQHKRLELSNGRRATLYPDDEIVVCYGNRYAPDQFEAEIPEDLSPCNLVAAGGVASHCLSRNVRMRAPTRITPVGVLADAEGRPLNLSRYSIEQKSAPQMRPTVTAVIGTSMNAGKTTTLAGLSLGMTRRGLTVGAAKVTGTGAGGDVWQMVDAGSQAALDFTDCGVPSTYKLTLETCEAVMETLVGHLCERGVDHILVEVADGILQEETRALIQSPVFSRLVDQVVFAAGDALGAANGVAWLRQQKIKVVGVSGALTCAPLAIRECAGLIDLPVLDLPTLVQGQWQLDHLHSDAQPQPRVA